MEMQELLPNLDFINGETRWVIQVFIVVLAVVIVNFIQRRILNRIHKRLETTSNIWDDALLDVVKKPLSLLIWIVGIAFAAQIVHQETKAPIFEFIGPVRDLGVIFCITWFLTRLVRTLEDKIVQTKQIQGKPVDRATADAVGKLLRVSVIITAVLVALQTLGFSVSGILAFGGIGGIAVGFAAKDLLANFFGGLMIYLDRPFVVGEWVRSPDRDIEGTVEEIGWRLTRIRTFDKRPIYVPNAVFSTVVVQTPSRMTHRRIYETIGIRYDDAAKVRDITAAVKNMLLEHEGLDTTQTLMVNFNAFGPSSLDFFIYTFTKTTNWIEFHAVKHDVLLKVHDIIEDHGAQVAFPTRTLHVPEAVTVASEEQQASVTPLRQST